MAEKDHADEGYSLAVILTLQKIFKICSVPWHCRRLEAGFKVMAGPVLFMVQVGEQKLAAATCSTLGAPGASAAPPASSIGFSSGV